jgi:predicted N-acetyltransferase YhbS
MYTDSKMSALEKAVTKRMDKVTGPWMKKMHTAHGSMPHWYVQVMAVDPGAQGKRHCSRLMRAVCQLADKEGLACYLEASGPRNRAVYERFGFQVVETGTLEVEGDEEGSEPFTEAYAMVRAVGGIAAVQKDSTPAQHQVLPVSEEGVMERG